MAQARVFNVAGQIITKLGSLALKEIELLWGVKEDLENLENTISAIRAVLLDAEEEQKQNNRFRDWLGKLKDAVYDADDLVDDFYAEALRQEVMSGSKMTKKVRIFLSSSNQLVYGLNMGHKIKKLRERLDKIADDRLKFDFMVRDVKQNVENKERKQTQSFVLEEEVIGREKDKEEIVKLLIESKDEENISVISIVGIGGLGKTTLAQLAFNDKRVKTNFETAMWVCVSDDFDVQIIAEKILKSIHIEKEKPENDERKEKEKPENDERKEKPENVESELRKKINGKKYLLVLDDVWNEDQLKWQSLRSLLIGGQKGSKIVVTTRSKLVADITRPVSTYNLQGLSESQSWSLLKKVAFLDQEQQSKIQILEPIGKEIAKKCLGVPLAVKTIGRVLYFKRTELEWSNVRDNEFATITQHENSILPILKLSFDHLPSHLKHCFAYCSLFPKDYVIDKQSLINLWMAQGFIQSSTGDQQLEDVGHEYFMDLVWRSFFQEVQTDIVGNVKSCKIHDLMHDLSQLVAGIECTIVNLGAKNIDKRSRHVSIGYDISSSRKIPTALLKANKIRTFLLPAQGKLKKSNCDKIVSTYNCLRALDLHNLELKKVSRSIGKLKHLRYLDLSRNSVEKLPNSISRLHNLQTLNLTDCDELVELPSDIRKMVNLRHLLIGGWNGWTGMPKGLGQLTSLRTLSLFVVGDRRGSGKLGELNGLNNLRGELEIRILQNATSAEARAANLKAKQYLQSLRLDWSYKKSNPYPGDERMLDGLEPNPNLKQLSVSEFSGVIFSHWLSSLTNIVEIKLKDCRECKHLPPLDHLPSLEILHLEELSDLEYMRSEESSTSTTTTTTTVFPSLKELNLTACYNLKGWWKNDDDGSSADSTTTTTSMAELPSFPCLSKLKILWCPNLISMPLYPSLEEDLYLCLTSSKPLQQTMMMKMKMERMMNSAAPSTSSSSSSSSYPFSRLKSLSISSIRDLESLPEEGLRNLTSLQSLEILRCPGLMSLPAEGFRGLTSLRSLQIWGCDRLKSLSGVFQHLTALEKLTIRDCEELDLSSDGMQWQGLKSLSSLSIANLPQLVCLPEGLQHLTTLEELEIRNCEQLDLSDARILFKDSQNLRTLMLQGIPKLVSLPDWLLQHVTTLQTLEIQDCCRFTSLPAEGFRGLTSLRSLEIWRCDSLKSMSGVFQHLTALEKLTIKNCKKLDLSSDGMQWQGLKSLSSLSIENLPQLVCLPEGLQHLTTLEELEIRNCEQLDLSDARILFKDSQNLRTLMLQGIPKLVSLPDWLLQHVTTLQTLKIQDCCSFTSLPECIGNLTSLQMLRLWTCPKLTSLPEGMHQLTTLKYLEINGCRELSKQCRKNMGVEWPKIAHIPRIRTDLEYIP